VLAGLVAYSFMTGGEFQIAMLSQFRR